VQDGTETDLDCGGRECLECDAGQQCAGDLDCYTDVCNGGVCAPCNPAACTSIAFIVPCCNALGRCGIDLLGICS
jgi:hypothetical protein